MPVSGANVMALPIVSDVLRRLRRMVAQPDDHHQSDADLLQRFLAARDETAFAELVLRHGSLVLGVSRSLLGHQQDAEDVFQAVFLVLARKAGSIRNQTSLASWLHGVAHRLALKARSQSKRRERREQSTLAKTESASLMDDLTWRELRDILHQEVSRLPEKLRLPVLLCHWEGQTQEEAARHMGCPKATLKDRLERARGLLRDRLARRGLVPAVPLFAAWLAGESLAEAASSGLTQTTARAALLFAAEQGGPALSRRASELAQGALHVMFMNTLKFTAAASLLLVAVTAGTVLAVHSMWPQKQARQPEPPAPRADGDTRPRLDVSGDPLPAGTLNRLGSLRFRQGKQLKSVSFSADGQRLATCSTDSVINLWDVKTGKALLRFNEEQHSDLVQTVTLSPDGKHIAAGYQRGRLILRDAVTAQEVAAFAGLQAHVSCHLFSPDGKRLYAGELDHAPVRCWDVATRQELQTFAGHKGGTKRLSVSAAGKRLASCGYDYHIAVYDTETGKELRRWRDPQGESTYDVALSPDGKFLAGGGYLKKVTVWDLATGDKVWQGDAHRDWVNVVAFTPDGKHLASGGRDATVILWDAGTGKQVYQIKEPRNSIRSMAFAPDGKTLAIASGSAVLLHDTATGKPLTPVEGHLGEVYSIAQSPDGKVLASGAQDGSVILWEASTGRELRRLAAHLNYDVYAVTFSPDGKLIASGANDGKICLWKTSGEKLAVYEGHKSCIGFLNFTPDGKQLVSVDWFDGGVIVWDLLDGDGKVRAKGQQVRSFKLHENRASYVAFSPDGKTLAAADEANQRFTGFGGGPCTIRLWDVTTGNELSKLGGHNGGQIRGMAFSPDGKTLAVGDTIFPTGQVRLFDVATGKEISQLKGPAEKVAFSPDGRTLATVPQYDGPEIKLFEIATGLERGRLQGHRDGVMNIAFSPDGKRLISASKDTTLLIWDLVGPMPKEPLSAKDFATLWQNLTDADGLKSFRAVQVVAALPKQTLPHLKERLAVVEPKRLERLLNDLDSDQFTVRDTAGDELTRIAPLVEPALKRASEDHSSLEVRRRTARLLEQVPLRVARLVEVLELMGTAEARALLDELAKGPSELRLTREAKTAVQRIPKR